MAYTNSPLVSVTQISPNRNSPRNHAIDTITIHCYVGQVSVERGLSGFADPARQASCNYIIGTDGRIGLCVEERDRSWCSSSSSNDHRSLTVECASDNYSPYAFNDAVMKSLKALVVDICQRNGIKKLIWSDSKTDRVNHVNGCNVTCHRDFSAKECPGSWFYSKEKSFCDEVNAILNPAVATQPVQPALPGFTYVNSDGYIINVFDIKNEWTAWFAAASAFKDKPKKAYTAKNIALIEKADLVTNLALFDTKKATKYNTVNYVRTSALQEVGYGGTSEIVELNWANKCAGYAVAIKDGVVQKNTPKNRYLGGTSCRNGIGLTTDGRLILAQSIKKVTESAFASKVRSFVPAVYGVQVKLFLFEDGGGSTQQYSSLSKQNFIPMGTRAVPTFTCLKRKALSQVTRTLSKDCRGWDVLRLQTVLGGIPCDGLYGAKTEAKVKAAQRALGIAANGIAGSQTLRALGL